MILRKHLSILLISTFFTLFLFANENIFIKEQTHIIQNWNSNDGLPQNTIFSIIQTPDAYLWIGTDEGAVKFNGSEFIPANMPRDKHAGFKTYSARNILFDKKRSILWIATDNGNLIKHNYVTGKSDLFDMNIGKDSSQVRSLNIDSFGNIWIGLKNGALLKFDGDKNLKFLRNPLGKNHSIEKIIITGGITWFIEYSGTLYKYDDKKLYELTPEGLSVTDFFIDKENRLWIGTFDDGVFLYDTKTKEVKYAGLKNSRIKSIFQAYDGTFWVGTHKEGLYQFSLENDLFVEKAFFSLRMITTITEDFEKNIWVGTFASGLYKLTKGKFSIYDTIEELSGGIPFSLEGCDDRLYIGSMGGGLNIIEGKNAKIESFGDIIPPDSNILTMASDPKSKDFWFAVEKTGVYCVGNCGKKNKNVKTFKGEMYKETSVLFVDNEENLWVGTFGKGVAKFKDGKLLEKYDGKEWTNSDVTGIIQDKKGNIWISTSENGIKQINNGKLISYKAKDGLLDNAILSIFEDSSGKIWLTSRNGINVRTKKGRIFSFSRNNGLPTGYIYAIIEDNNKNLWATSNNGIIFINSKDVKDYISGKTKRINTRLYTTEDGLPTNEFNGYTQRNIYKDYTGKIFFPSVKGVVSVKPDSMPVNNVAPPVKIEKIIIDGNKVPTKWQHILDPDVKRVEFHFKALSYTSPERVRYRYKLEGFDKDWVDAKDRETASYTNLEAGLYSFKVIASNNDGLWNNEGAVFSFEKKPHFYETPWFILFSVMALQILFIAIYKVRVHRFKKIKKDLEKEVAKRTSELQKANAMLSDREEHLVHLVEEKTIKIDSITTAMVTALENANSFNDSDTGDHIQRVREYSAVLAEEFGCDKEFIKRIKLYSSLHDIGKVGVPDSILKKPGRYTPEEFEEMKKHVEIGAKMLDKANIDDMAKNIAKYHHEKWNGQGYIYHLMGNEIPLEARIVAVADVYDALVSKRVYKDAYAEEKADSIIKTNAGEHFDPRLVEIFFRVKSRLMKIRDTY